MLCWIWWGINSINTWVGLLAKFGLEESLGGKIKTKSVNALGVVFCAMTHVIVNMFFQTVTIKP